MKIDALLLAVLTTFSTILASASVLYVDVNSANPVPPYIDWSTAATNIQDAVDAASGGDNILVTDGVYEAGSGTSSDGTTNRVLVTKVVTIESVNGPGRTTIDGGDSMRCVYLTNGAVLSGFRLTNGTAGNGGGVCCASTNALISNCVLANNTASSGGGAYSGTLTNCTLSRNTAYQGGGVWSSVLAACTLSANTAYEGGGTYSSTLTSCTLNANSGQFGGGAYFGTLDTCTLTGNCSGYGGGACSAALTNCALNTNTAGAGGGGAVNSWLDNCTLVSNSALG